MVTDAARNTQVPETEPAPPAPERLYKVVGADHQSTHGGAFDWTDYLPAGEQPGRWTPALTGELILCKHAWHLTDDPYEWWTVGSRVYEAAGQGAALAEGDKRGYRAVRLLREVPWSEFQVYSEGTHAVTSGRCRAWDSATVRASGSATVEAWDSAIVEAWGSATVRAWDSATVRASGSATVEAWGSATVRAWGSATVISTPWHDVAARLTLRDQAVHIDRRGGRLRLRGARGATLEVPDGSDA